jgi:hypothetical protein
VKATEIIDAIEELSRTMDRLIKSIETRNGHTSRR